jgi:hypothetical protein
MWEVFGNTSISALLVRYKAKRTQAGHGVPPRHLFE